MNDRARFLIAQLVPDLFRRETVNVGVFVIKGERVSARLLGETSPGSSHLDRRKVRSLLHPDVYAQWFSYLKSIISEVSDVAEVEQAIKAGNGGNYNVIAAGEVGDVGSDSPEEIANSLYPLLVSTGGLAESLGIHDESEEVVVAKLQEAVTDEFKSAEILQTEPGSMLGVPHPIQRGVELRGASAPHSPTYVQENGALWVMETIDFTSAKRNQTKERAGRAAFMFEDIAKARSDHSRKLQAVVKPVAIIRARPSDEDHPSVANGFEMLENRARVVNWLI